MPKQKTTPTIGTVDRCACGAWIVFNGRDWVAYAAADHQSYPCSLGGQHKPGGGAS